MLVCVCVLLHFGMWVLTSVCVCVCSLCAHMHSLFAALGATKYLKCRHGTVISEQGLKVGHNSAGPGQDLSQEKKDWGGMEKGQGAVFTEQRLKETPD